MVKKSKDKDTFQPMLAATLKEGNQIEFPAFVSPKLDGIRCVIVDNKPVSRTMKVFPNKSVVEKLSKEELNTLDGELIVGEPNDPQAMNNAMRGIMREDGEPDFTFWVFDTAAVSHKDVPFSNRLTSVSLMVMNLKLPYVKMVPQEYVETQEQLDAFEQKMLELGYEGVMIRSITGPYKYGRSTFKEGYLIKIKRFSDAEARIVGFEERMHNANEPELDAFGRTKRSSHQDNKVGRGDLGALVVERNGVQFNIGTGFSDALRREIWDNKDQWLGKLVVFRHFEHGAVDAPRHPVYHSLRSEIDQ